MKISDWHYIIRFSCGGHRPGSILKYIESGEISHGDTGEILSNNGDVLCKIQYVLDSSGNHLFVIASQVLPDGFKLPRLDGISYSLYNVTGPLEVV